MIPLGYTLIGYVNKYVVIHSGGFINRRPTPYYTEPVYALLPAASAPVTPPPAPQVIPPVEEHVWEDEGGFCPGDPEIIPAPKQPQPEWG